MIRRPPKSTLFPSPPLFRSFDHRPKTLRRRDRLQPRHAGPQDQHARGLHRSGSGHQHREKASALRRDRKSTRLNSSHLVISYAVFCLKKKKTKVITTLAVIV